MQGLPAHLLPKSNQARRLEDKFSVKTEKDNGVEELNSKDAKKSDFSTMFEGMTEAKDNEEASAEPKSAESKSELKSESKNEIVKNLLAGKNQIHSALGENEEESEEVQVVLDPKQAEALIAALAAGNKKEITLTAITGSAKNTEANVEQKLTKTSSNLDQLLNSLKGTQDGADALQEVSEEGADPLQGMRSKKSDRPGKVELKSETPLDFLMNGAKTKDVSVAAPVENKSDIEKLLGQNKMMTGEDYIKNMNSADKSGAPKLVLLEGMDVAKNPNQNVKAYGQGLSLLSDPLIKNTKDLASKDKNGVKNASIDELRSPDLKVGAELSAVKQEVIPMMHNKENHGQQNESQTQANQKVLDLGKINTANTTEIIRRISDYVEQNQVANKSSLDLTVKHDSLGEFKIQVSKMPGQSANMGQNLIDMQITTSSKEGHDFFMKNEIGLLKNLNGAGINLSDLRIVSSMAESSTSGQTDSRQSNSQNGADSGSKQFANSGSFSSEAGNGKERRKELWEEYQQRYGA